MRIKFLFLAVVAVVIVGLIVVTRTGKTKPEIPVAEKPAAADADVDDFNPTDTKSRGYRAPNVAEETAGTNATNRLRALLESGEPRRITSEQAEEFVRQNNRSADSLLAASDASGDRKFLREAMEKYPNDPRVAYRAAYLGAPEGLTEEEQLKFKRHWLSAFKEDAPDNGMADYLSAREHFRAGETELALKEINAAANKPIKDYSREFMQSAEEAYRSAGYSEAEAKVLATTTLLLPQLADFKAVGTSLVDMAKAYRASGDESSALAALQMARQFGTRLDGDDSSTLIQTLVGMAIQRMALNSLDPKATFGEGNQTVQSLIDDLQRRREEYKKLAGQSALMFQRMSEADYASYFERQRLFGEPAAMKWAMEKYGMP